MAWEQGGGHNNTRMFLFTDSMYTVGLKNSDHSCSKWHRFQGSNYSGRKNH